LLKTETNDTFLPQKYETEKTKYYEIVTTER
jgi:hypothetical protein